MSLPDFQEWLSWSAAYPGWVLAIGFGLAFVEALAVIGILVPGIILLFLLAALVGWNPPMLLALSLALLTGAVAGDGLSFWLGYRYRGRIGTVWPLKNRAQWLAIGEQFFLRHGGKSIFIARFVGPLRPIVPLVAGSMGMRPADFVPRMLIACLLWTPLMVLPGALFGESLELAGEFGGRLTVLLLVLVVGGWLLAWVTRLVYEWGARRAPWWLKNLALWLRRHPLMGRWIGPLFQPGGREVLTVAILGLLLVASLAALFGALLLAPLSTSAWEAEFELAGLAASLRNHFADPLFFVAVLAQARFVLGVLIVALALLLTMQKRWNALVHWLMATLGGWMMALMLNALMGLLLNRPPIPGSIAQVPHLEMTLSTLVFGFFALMLGKDSRPRQRKWLYLATVVWLGLLAFSQFYLARATLNGLIAGIALGAGWLALTGIGYRLRAKAYRAPGRLLAAFVGVWILTALLNVVDDYDAFSGQHQLSQPLRNFETEQWWAHGWQELPALRSRVGRIESQRFDAQVAMPLRQLQRTLAQRGWQPPQRLSLDSLRAIFSKRIDPEKLPHLQRDFTGSPEDLALRKKLDASRVVLLRAWDSGARVGTGEVPIWLLQLQVLEPVTRIGFFNTWAEVEVGSAKAVEILRSDGSGWQWRKPAEGRPWLVVGDDRVALDDAKAGSGTEPGF
ncbi:MAG: VTT domain-containing protein [Wenzhouxiangellaceae bacterium]|nr:VTT domain-containing protein [Wenzhouxiangellaceae bacterium]